MRSAVGKAVGIRLTPTLEFIPDAMPENAAHIEELLARRRGPPTRRPRRGRAGAVRRRARPLQASRRRRRAWTTRTRPRRCDRAVAVVVDKPAGWTSHDVVARVRRLCRHPQGRPRRHARPDGDRGAGARGRPGDAAARPSSSAADKAYAATIRLGAGDRHRRRRGRGRRRRRRPRRDRPRSRRRSRGSTGDDRAGAQRRSRAIKVNGERSYARVRAGEDGRAAGAAR